jgi:hypothetical protein
MMAACRVLACEAVQARRDPGHPKPRRVVSQAQVVADRRRRAVAIQLVVPTAVRVEVGWDRTSPAWVFPNRLRIVDSPLDAARASTAAGIRDRTGVSATSGPGDMRRVAGGKNITVATI